MDDIFKHLKIIEKLYKVVASCETLELIKYTKS